MMMLCGSLVFSVSRSFLRLSRSAVLPVASKETPGEQQTLQARRTRGKRSPARAESTSQARGTTTETT